MVITAKDLRDSAGRIIKLVESGKEVTVTYRGKAAGRIIPIRHEVEVSSMAGDAAFGMWADNSEVSNVVSFVRDMRESRAYDY